MARINDKGTFVPTTQSFDRSLIAQLSIDPTLKDFLIRLSDTTNNIASALNTKITSINIEDEILTGAQWYKDPSLSSLTSQDPQYRGEYSKIILFGALPDGTASTTKSVAHGITFDATTTFVEIKGTATKTSSAYAAIPVPYSSPTLANNIQVDVDATNITVTVDATIDWSPYDTCIFVLKMLHQ